MNRITSLRCLLAIALTFFTTGAIAETYTIPFSEIRTTVDTTGESPDAVIRAYFAGLVRGELDSLGFNDDGGLVLDNIPLDEITRRIADDCDFPRPYKVHTDATTASVSIDDSSSLTIDLDSIRSITLQADLTGTASTEADAWVRWGQDIIFIGDCVRLSTDHGWIGLTQPFDIHLDLALDLSPRYDSELIAVVVDKHATLAGYAEVNGGDIDHDFGLASPTDLVISVFKEEMLEELSTSGEQAVSDAIAGLNYRLDGLDEDGLPDPTIEAFNGPTTFVLEVSDEDQPFVRDLLKQYGIPDIVIALLNDRGIEVLLQLAILEGAERDAYLAELGATASCEVLLAAFETPLELVPLYTFNGPDCEAVDPDAPEAGAYFSDAACAEPVAYRKTEDAEFCAERFGEESESLLGNAAAWVADTDQPNDPLPEFRSRSWTTIPSTQLDLGAISLAGNHQPYMKQVSYKTIDDVGRGNGSCELEMRVYKGDITAQDLMPVIALHGGTWEHRGFSFFGLEAGISQLTERGFVVFAPFYRLVGDSDGNDECNAASWFEVTEDVESALDWVAEHGAALGAADELPRVYGQSAGAHLSAWLAAHRPDDVGKALLFYGPLDVVDFLTGALPVGGPYESYRRFGLRSLTRFFGAGDLNNEVRLDQIDFAAATVELLRDDWDTLIPDSVFGLRGVDVLAPPAFLGRCAEIAQIDLAAIDLAAPPAELLGCLKSDLSDFLVKNSFAHLLRDEAVPIYAVHGTADSLVPYQQSLAVCGAIDGIELPDQVYDPLTTYACGVSSEAQIVAGADHALELGICLDSICPAGAVGSETRAAVETAINLAFDWLLLDPVVATDSDGDGVLDHQDAFPLDPLESVDTDQDGLGNNADTDDDNDGWLDGDDALPLDPAEHLDTDGDGVGNTADDDDDDDGIADAGDNCPVVQNSNQADGDGNGVGDVCDPQFTIATSLPDVNSNGSADVAVLVQDRNTGEFIAYLRDGSTAGLISVINFGAEQVIAMQSTGDLNGDGSPEIAVLGLRTSGVARVQVRDTANGAPVADIDFSDGFAPSGLAALPDSDGDGEMELAVLATRVSDGRYAAEVRNVGAPDTPRFIWFAPDHSPLAIASIPGDADGNGIAELAVLSARNSDGRNLVEVKNAAGAKNTKWLWMAPGNAAIDIAVVDGDDAVGVPKVAVISSRISDGRGLVQVRNGDGSAGSTTLWLAPNHSALALQTVDDTDSDGEFEVAALSERNSDGRILVEVKNVSGAVNTRSIWYSPGYTAHGIVTLDDIDGNGIDEAAVLMIRDSDGRVVLQGRNVTGSPATTNYWF